MAVEFVTVPLRGEGICAWMTSERGCQNPKHVDTALTYSSMRFVHAAVVRMSTGLDESKQRLLFFASSSLEAKLNIKIPLRALRKFGLLTVGLTLKDSGKAFVALRLSLYVFQTATQALVVSLIPVPVMPAFGGCQLFSGHSKAAV